MIIFGSITSEKRFFGKPHRERQKREKVNRRTQIEMLRANPLYREEHFPMHVQSSYHKNLIFEVEMRRRQLLIQTKRPDPICVEA